jgi:hypothetical protein
VKHSRHPNGHDGDQNDKVHEVVKAVETGIIGGKHEWRRIGAGVGVFGQQILVI